MISIFDSMKVLDREEARAQAFTRTITIVLGAIERAMKRLMSPRNSFPPVDLEPIRIELSRGAPPDVLQQQGEQLEKELEEFSLDLALSIKQKDEIYEATVKLLSGAATIFSESGSAHSRKLQDLTSEIMAASRLNSVVDLREQLAGRIVELHDMAERMEREGQARARTLDQQLNALNLRLLSAENRAETDETTGLGNRRRLEREVTRAIASSRRFSFILFDLDSFKAVNDSYGHQRGDEVLKTVAKGLKTSLKRGDLACRWGGDEFALLVYDCENVDAGVLARRISESTFGEFFIDCGGVATRVNIRASYGIASYRTGDTAGDLLERADQTLYAQKRQRHGL